MEEGIGPFVWPLGKVVECAELKSWVYGKIVGVIM